MSDRSPSPIGVILGAGIVALMALVFVLTSLAREPVAPAPTAVPASPTPTAVPATPTSTATALPPTPSGDVVAATVDDVSISPEVAPDFTLQGARGIELTLSEQLAQGPVVLAFFRRGGG